MCIRDRSKGLPKHAEEHLLDSKTRNSTGPRAGPGRPGPGQDGPGPGRMGRAWAGMGRLDAHTGQRGTPRRQEEPQNRGEACRSSRTRGSEGHPADKRNHEFEVDGGRCLTLKTLLY